MEKKGSNVGVRILQVVMVLFGVFATVCGIALPVILIAAVPYDLLVVLLIRVMNKNIREGRGAFMSDKAARERKSMERAERSRVKMEKSLYGAKPAEALHVSGLPLAIGIPCTIHSEAGLYRIESGAAHFTLEKRKVVDVSVKTDEEIERQYVSSVGRAALGGLIAGPVGIILGGMAQKKVVARTKTNYLFITYDGKDGLDCIALEEVKPPFGSKVQGFPALASEFRQGTGFGQPHVQEL